MVVRAAKSRTLSEVVRGICTPSHVFDTIGIWDAAHRTFVSLLDKTHKPL